jgi:hypothetical protein
VKSRPATETSERQLAQALTTSGRRVSLADIAKWRQNGLLPRLTDHGLGQGRGKTHCWHNADIVARAELVCDAIRQYAPTVTGLLRIANGN